jgi:hypothetical protein
MDDTGADEKDAYVADTFGVDPSRYAAPKPESGLFDGIASALGSVVDSVEGAASSVYDSAAGAVHEVVDDVETTASSVYDSVSGAVGSIVDSVEGAASSVYDSAAGAVHEVVDDVETTASSVYDSVSGAVGSVVDSVESVASSVYDSAAGAVHEVVDSVEGAASNLYGSVSGAASRLVDSVEGAAAAAAGVIDTGYHAVAGAVGGVINAVGNTVGNVIGAAEDLFDAGPKAKEIAETSDKVSKMSDADLKKLPAADKVAMLKTLTENGALTPQALEAQKKIYRDMDLDPDFRKRDEAREDKIAADLKGDKALESAHDNWNTTSETDKLKALQKIVAAQSKEYGIPPPEIVIEHNPPKNGIITNGYFDPSDGKLHINMDPASSVQNFAGAVDLAIHENAHNYQQHLVDALNAGKIKPGDPDYTQATMFAANSDPHGYVEAQTPADLADYRKQPLEDHSWQTGPSTANKIIKQL